MSRFLRIQNRGEAPLEGFTMLGVSGTASQGDAQTIGMFGSGNKLALNLFLRNGIKPVVFCGGLKLSFSCELKTMDEGEVGSKDYGQVHCRATGRHNGGQVNRMLPLSWAANWGEKDWDHMWMGCREFTANAIDRTIRQEGDFLPAIKRGDLIVDVCSENQVRAKTGYTRVFLPLEVPEVSAFYVSLPKLFLHFSEHPEEVSQKILPKGHNLKDDSFNPVIYHHGVFIREVAGVPSVFDYNFTRNELRIDECRNCNDHTVRSAVAEAVKWADEDSLTTIFRRLLQAEPTFEASLGDWDLSFRYECGEKKDEAQARWNRAWVRAAGESVATSTDHGEALLKTRGHQAAQIPSNWLKAASELEAIKTDASVLSKPEAAGNQLMEPTFELKETVQTVWGWMEKLELTNGKEKPGCGCFVRLVEGGCQTLGCYDSGKILVEKDHAGSMGPELQKTVLDEMTHHITGSGDISRDFQEFLMKVVVRMADATMF